MHRRYPHSTIDFLKRLWYYANSVFQTKIYKKEYIMTELQPKLEEAELIQAAREAAALALHHSLEQPVEL